jgi:hypothetical protein
MLRRLFPKEEEFFDMFIRASKNIVDCALLLKELMENYTDVKNKIHKITEREHEGDTITHEIIKRLNRSFITPIDREDIYALTSAMDDVLDLMEAAADRMILYKVEYTTPESRQLATILVQMAQEIEKAIKNLPRMDGIAEHCVEVNRLENLADQVTKSAIAALFNGDQDPITIMKWKEIYETLETATDKGEDVVNVLEAVVLKNA